MSHPKPSGVVHRAMYDQLRADLATAKERDEHVSKQVERICAERVTLADKLATVTAELDEAVARMEVCQAVRVRKWDCWQAEQRAHAETKAVLAAAVALLRTVDDDNAAIDFDAVREFLETHALVR
jgi:hypothetical protein